MIQQMTRHISLLMFCALVASSPGCQGIPTSVGVATQEIDAAAARYRAGYRSVSEAYLRDVRSLLDDAVSAEGVQAMQAKAAEGKVRLEDALGVLASDADKRKKVRAKLDEMRVRLATNEAHFQTWKDLSGAVHQLLKSLERSASADARLQKQALDAAKKAGSAGKGGF